PLLVEYFLNKPQQGGSSRHIRKIDPKVYEAFQRYDWPGNIRELENTVERLKILSENGEIHLEDVPFNIRMPKTSLPSEAAGELSVQMTLAEMEKHQILRVLSYHHGNKTKTAQSLGITIK